MNITRNSDGSYSASSEGYDYPIAAEGETPEAAESAHNDAYGEQYAKAQTQTALSMLSEGRKEKKYEDARMLAADYRSQMK